MTNAGSSTRRNLRRQSIQELPNFRGEGVAVGVVRKCPEPWMVTTLLFGIQAA